MMTEYTPTTLDVLESYKGQIIATGKPNVYEVIDETQAIAEFGRWLNGERQRVAKHAAEKERKRIVKAVSEFTAHSGKTHYVGINCQICRIIDIVEPDSDD
jgi:hypothetical protein